MMTTIVTTATTAIFERDSAERWPARRERSAVRTILHCDDPRGPGSGISRTLMRTLCFTDAGWRPIYVKM